MKINDLQLSSNLNSSKDISNIINNDINKNYNDFNDYKDNCNTIEIISYNLNIINLILEKTKQKERTKKSNYFFSYVKKFSEQGVQGIVGVISLKKILKKEYSVFIQQNINKCASGGTSILSQYFTDIKNIIPSTYFINYDNIYISNDINKTSNDNSNIQPVKESGFPLVFKVSIDMNNMIQHEKNVAKQLYTLHSYCPHFINILGEFTIPINSCYIALNADEIEFDSDDESGSDDYNSDESGEDEYSDSDNSDNSDKYDESDISDSDFSEEEEEEEEINEEYQKEFENELERSKNLFHDTKDAFPRTVILYEKINNFPLHRYLKKINYDNNLMASQILQLLLALQIAQNKFNFTHYDLHTTNVLQQRCEFNSVFLYNIDNVKYLVPTYGYYPKIIDVGSSYCDEVSNHTMLTHANSYDYGFQSQFFDPLNDIHHSLLSLFYYIEDKKSCFDSLCNKLKHIFFRLPVLRKSGWKKLPHDLTDTVFWKIKKDCLPEYESYEIFREYKGNFLEVLNSLVYIPFDKDLNKDILNTDISKFTNKELYDFIEKHPIINFKICFHNVMKELEKMFYNEEVCGEDIIFTLKELFFLILKYKKDLLNDKNKLLLKYKDLEEAKDKYEEYSKLKNIKHNKNNQKLFNQYTSEFNKIKKEVENLEKIYNKIKQELKEKTQSHIESYVEYDNINYFNLVHGFIETGTNVQSIYYLLTKDHQKIIKDAYKDTILKKPVDMYEYLSRNVTPSFNINKDTIVYYWDTDNKMNKKHVNFFNENDKNYTDVNTLPFNKKAEKIFQLLK